MEEPEGLEEKEGLGETEQLEAEATVWAAG